jgi:23S rRNA (adenine2030-N6)-methyltransferase
MLSYQHGFHAGNFADLHKHVVITALLTALNAKNKPWSYLETHSGRALYNLADDQSQKTGEYREGIERLWQQASADGLATYRGLIEQLNPDGVLSVYPGSPMLAQLMARADDRIRLMELHPAEFDVLRAVFSDDARVAVHHRDGYEGVLSQLPPMPRRGMVLVDPAYEVKDEYETVPRFLSKAQRRWATGVYAIWYPLLAANRWQSMVEQVAQVSTASVLCSEFRAADVDAGGMYGSGMLIVNAPWQLDQRLAEQLPILARLLGLAESAPTLNWLVKPT